VGDVPRVAGFKNQAPMFNFLRRKNVVLSIDSDKTDEAELHAAVSGAVQHLAPFGASLVEYTSYADAGTSPGHYVLFWGARGHGDARAAAVFEDCCLAVEEARNSVYHQGAPPTAPSGRWRSGWCPTARSTSSWTTLARVAPPSTSTRRLMIELYSEPLISNGRERDCCGR